VHVGQTGDQKFSRGINYSGAGRNFHGRVGADCGDARAIEQDGRVGLRRSAGGIDNCDVGDGDGGGRGMGARSEEKKDWKEKKDKGRRTVRSEWHVLIVSE
jgi:hypothetical protein